MAVVAIVRRNEFGVKQLIGAMEVEHPRATPDAVLRRMEQRDLMRLNDGQGPDEMQRRHLMRMLRENRVLAIPAGRAR